MGRRLGYKTFSSLNDGVGYLNVRANRRYMYCLGRGWLTHDPETYELKITPAGAARLDLDGRGLPVAMREVIFKRIPPDKSRWRSTWNMYLSDMRGMMDSFKRALEIPDAMVFRSQCEDDPQEICVRITGVDRRGVHWNEQNVILLAPWWEEKNFVAACEAMAEAIVDSWDELKALG